MHQGGRYDAVSGLYSFRHRDYSPTLQRWVQQDPMGYVDGASLYQYVRSSPVTFVDPSGFGVGNTLDRWASDGTSSIENSGMNPYVGGFLSGNIETLRRLGHMLAPQDDLAKLPGKMKGDYKADRCRGRSVLDSLLNTIGKNTPLLNLGWGLGEAILGEAQGGMDHGRKLDGYEIGERIANFVSAEAAAAAAWKATQTRTSQNNATASPSEPYNRQQHYGKTPTSADRQALGAGPDQVVDHQPPLVKRYYEGDPAIGEPPGYTMTEAERRASGTDRSRMQLQSKEESRAQGGKMSAYSKQQKEKHGL